MARKFGKKVEIDLNILRYNLGIIGEAGIGKSTVAKEICEKLVGEDGYISLNIGKEDGHGAIAGIISADIPDWATFKDFIDDVVENRDTDYKDLKVVIIDTLDQLFELAEAETIRQYNKTAEVKARTINQSWGGFGRGLDYTIKLVLDALWELKDVGVSFFVIAHVKRTDVADIMSEEQYTVLTSNITQKYFNAVKQKLDLLGVAYIDREIVKEKTKKKDANGNYVEKGKIAAESRVISFRDDTYSLDSKSRFANITPKIPLDADAFIKAVQDAILAEQSKEGISLEEAQRRQKIKDAEKEKAALEAAESVKHNRADVDRNVELISIVKEKFPNATDEIKASVKQIMSEYGISNFKDTAVSTEGLEKIVDLLK